jgi:hypothetical protein
MEQFNPLRLLGKYWLPVLVVTLVFFGLGLWANSNKPVSIFGSLSITTQAIPSYPESSQLILQSSSSGDTQLAVATTQTWLTDPSFTKQVLAASNVSTEGLSLKGLTKVFTIVTPAAFSSSYQIQYIGKSAEEVDRVLTNAKVELDKLKGEYNNKQNTGLKIESFYSSPTITSTGAGMPLTPIAGLLSGFIVAMVIVSLVERKKA